MKAKGRTAEQKLMQRFARRTVELAGQIHDSAVKVLEGEYDRMNLEYLHTMRPLGTVLRKIPKQKNVQLREELKRQANNQRERLDSYSRYLQERTEALRAWKKGTPSVKEVYQEIVAASGEMNGFFCEKQCIGFKTKAIEFEGVYLGPFKVYVTVHQVGERPWNYTVVAMDPHRHPHDSNLTHPHIGSDRLCEGNGKAALTSAAKAGRMFDFLTMIRSIVETYSPVSPYADIESWAGGSMCSNCDRRLRGDEEYGCHDCGNIFCCDCTGVCSVCEDTYCSNCLRRCETCGERLCYRERCANECSCHEEEENVEVKEEEKAVAENTGGVAGGAYTFRGSQVA